MNEWDEEQEADDEQVFINDLLDEPLSRVNGNIEADVITATPSDDFSLHSEKTSTKCSGSADSMIYI